VLALDRRALAALFNLAWPIVLARATQAVVSFSDALMVGPLGEDALAAATTGALNTMSVLILPMGTVFIVQSFAAQLEGRGRRGEARRFAWYGLIIAGATLAVSLLALPFVASILGLFDYTPNVHARMTDYLHYRLPSVGLAVGMEALGNWYGGLGNTRLQMRAGIVVMVTNISLNWVFIYGQLGAPALGVKGAALASALATSVGFIFMAVAFSRGLGGVAKAPGPLGLRLAEFWRVIRFGLPNGFNWFLEFGAFALFINVTMAHLGTVALAAINVVVAINSISFMPAFGVSSAGAILVGQAIGRRELDAVWPIVRMTGIVTVTWMVGVGLSYLIVPATLIGLFTPADQENPALVAMGATMLSLSTAWQLFDALAMTLSETLRAAGDTAWSLWARIALAWLVFTPVAAIAVFVWRGGAVAAMLCIILYMALLASALAWRFRSAAWRRIDLVGEPQLVE
jgi:MATE family multidrug resistance protein